MPARELSHSQAVAWFLDPSETHEQGAIFVAALLNHLKINVKNSNDAVVQLERPYRVDITVFAHHSFALCFENKVYHHERPEQFTDLLTALRHLRHIIKVPGHSSAAIFLTDDGRAPKTGPAFVPDIAIHCLSRRQLFTVFKQALDHQPTVSPLLASFLSTYIQAINEISLVA